MSAPKTQDIVAKLWNLCNVLKDDGVTYHQYVNELTYLLFLKMAQETKTESQIPSGYRWSDLTAREGAPLLEHYRLLLIYLGSHGSARVQAIFNNAATSIREPRHLHKLVTDINALDWYSARQEGLGDLYEGLLEKNATETESGAGQYFTPRPLIESLVAGMRPQAGEVIQDPACGTIGLPSTSSSVSYAKSPLLTRMPLWPHGRLRCLMLKEHDLFADRAILIALFEGDGEVWPIVRSALAGSGKREQSLIWFAVGLKQAHLLP